MGGFSVTQGRKLVEDFKNKGKGVSKSKTPAPDFTSKPEIKSEGLGLNTNKVNFDKNDEDSELAKLREELNGDVNTSEEVNKFEETNISESMSEKETSGKPFITTTEERTTASTRSIMEEIKHSNRSVEPNTEFRCNPVNKGDINSILTITPDPEVEPLRIEAIRDTEGYISAKVNRIEDKTGVSVIPFDLLGLLPQVVYIQGHEIIEVKGKKYVSGCTRKVNESLLYSYANKIENNILSGVEFDDSLMINCDFEGNRIETLKFNMKELSYLLAKFREMKPSVYTTRSGEYRINVGGDIGGY